MGADGRPGSSPTTPSRPERPLSQVFTGLSWYAGPQLTDRTAARFRGDNPNLERDWRPMQAYDEYTPNTSFHSISEKNFLGTTIPAMTKPTTDADVKIAHRHAVQQPERRPVHRQATDPAAGERATRVRPMSAASSAAFNNNGQGVRGDMKAVVKRGPAGSGSARGRYLGLGRQGPRAGAAPGALLRAFNATSISGCYHRHRPDRRPVGQPRPDADVRADGVQLLPSGLRADEQGDHRREPGRSRDADRAPTCRSRAT